MPSYDTNLHHLTTKAFLLICGAHRLWLTAGHAERISWKECREEGCTARARTHAHAHKHTQRSHTQIHPNITHTKITQIKIHFCPWWCEISCPHILSLSCYQAVCVCPEELLHKKPRQWFWTNMHNCPISSISMDTVKQQKQCHGMTDEKFG